MHPASNGERARSPAKFGKIVAAGFAPHQRDDTESADEREGIDRGVEEGRGKSVAPARDQSEQGVTGMRDGGVGEQAADIRLRERDEIANDDRKRGQHGQDRRPTGDHRVPVGAAVQRDRSRRARFFPGRRRTRPSIPTR